mmetsp:Transcript_97118/g.172934  ORF Transcript_97118/g.172934 Transcript_97118/m.172934 type:complete len:510 (+) Transcript_97118:45-1574(+)
MGSGSSAARLPSSEKDCMAVVAPGEPAWDISAAVAAESLLKAMEAGQALNPRSLAECSQVLESRPLCRYRNCYHATLRCPAIIPDSGKTCGNGCGRRAARGFDTCCKTCTMSGCTSHGSSCQRRSSDIDDGASTASGPSSTDSTRAACSNGCGRTAARGYDTCCRTCSSTGCKSHGQACEKRTAEDKPPSKSGACRYLHLDVIGADEQLWPKHLQASLCSPDSYANERPFRRANLAWQLFGKSFITLGRYEFVDACGRHEAAFAHFNSREGARMVARGLPHPDELQEFVLEQVAAVWGANVISREMCQEYLDRTGQIVQSRHTDSQYSPPSRSNIKVGGGAQDACSIARIIKVGINNHNVDLSKAVPRDTAWHGLAARGFPRWRESGPKFRADLAKRCAHGGSVYCTPAFEHAVAYSFRGAVSPEAGKPPFAAMTTKAGQKWNYSCIMQLAISDRGKKGVVEEKHQTFGSAPTDGWEPGQIEWVVHDVSKAQIYGILFCFFPDDKGWGA